MPKCGTFISHPAFGRGRVVKTESRISYLEGEREPELDDRLTVVFLNCEVRELLWSFCHTKVKVIWPTPKRRRLTSTA